MSKLNIWNTISLTQTGKVKMFDSGRELFGTVIQHGVNDKTVTVLVSSRHHNSKYKRFLYNRKKKQVHDEKNYCVSGDKVIIANCSQISKTKSYYIKTIVQPVPRLSIPKKEQQKIQTPAAPQPQAQAQVQAKTQPQPKAETKLNNKQKQKLLKDLKIKKNKKADKVV